MSGVRIKLFAEADHLEIEHRANTFLARNDIEYIDHQYIADGLDKPYNLSIAYRKKGNTSDPWRKKVFGQKGKVKANGL